MTEQTIYALIEAQERVKLWPTPEHQTAKALAELAALAEAGRDDDDVQAVIDHYFMFEIAA